MNKVNVTINDKKYSFKSGITLYDISKKFKSLFVLPIIGALVNGEVKELSDTILSDCNISFFDRNTKEGSTMYRNGLVFVLVYAVRKLYGKDASIKVCHSASKGRRIKINFDIKKSDLKKIKDEMNRIIKSNLKIDKTLIKREEAIKYFKSCGNDDKASAFNYLRSNYIYLYKLGNVYDYFYSKMPSRCDVLDSFDLIYVDSNNFILQTCSLYTNKIPNYKCSPLILDAYNDYYKRAKKLDIFCGYDVNRALSSGKIEDIIKLDEVISNDRLLELAKDISSKKDKIKIVLIAGPSSSGKTTTARKLSMFLKTFGLNPKSLSTDDYFIPRDKTPRLANGEYDFENINTVDLKLFNDHLSRLLNCEEVSIPTFNFVKGEGEYLGNVLKLEENDILIIEGLHGLNEKLTSLVPRENKYKIYVAPLSDLNIDNHNMISTSDIRLLRKIVRDNRTRGFSVCDSIRTWRVVREGEEKYIYPYQDDVDYVYNTAFIYEIGVLKVFAEPLLFEVSIDSPYYREARRLIDFLGLFLAIPNDVVPDDSLLCEFIGKSYFE